MNSQKVFEEIKSLLIEKLKLKSELIFENSKIISDLGLDSVEIVDILFLMEEQFKIKIVQDLETKKIEWPQTFSDLVQLVVLRQKEE